jgi:hypothetical protein
VGLQPGETAGQVKFLMITAKPYRDSSGNSLTYTVNDGTTGITLDAPQVLVGSGGVALLDSAPKSLSFTSTLSQDVSIQILVGRDATP